MEIDARIQSAVQQQNVAVVTDGRPVKLRATRTGQLMTADWKAEFVLAGYCFNVSVGAVGGAASITAIVGGGAGTTVNADEPEMAIGTPAGYYHIPLGFKCAVQGDSAADADVANIFLMADLTQLMTLPIAASATVETPQNLLDGGPASVSTAQSAVTTAISPTSLGTVILDFATNRHAQITNLGTVIQELRMDYEPSFPSLFKGPCSIHACWGGTVAQSGMCSYNWAEVPIARFE